jgi:hypothetical protein
VPGPGGHHERGQGRTARRLLASRWIRHPSDYQWHGVSVERIRCDRVLHEALTARADPLHPAEVFGLSYCTASKYTLIACDVLAGQPATAQFAGWIWGRQLALTIRV